MDENSARIIEALLKRQDELAQRRAVLQDRLYQAQLEEQRRSDEGLFSTTFPSIDIESQLSELSRESDDLHDQIDRLI